MPLYRTIIKRPNASKLQTSFTAAALAKRYGFPKINAMATDAVAIVELGGGYSDADNKSYCQQLGIPLPPVTAIGVDGATNSYTGDPNSADGEVALDVQNILGATGGKVPILVYFAPNSSQGFANAIMKVATDNKACALSISWGQDEAGWTPGDMQAMDAAFQACAAAGITCFAASGDGGSADGGNGDNVDYPSSSPYCVGCGGTSITATGEVAWGSGGGGLSKVYKKPDWQTPNLSARGVPDVAADADPNTGYAITIAGQGFTFGGTSAVAPMWAALVALVVATTGKRIGFILPQIYLTNNLTDITTGSNGSFQAHPGYDECTGLGIPNATFVGSLLSVGQPPTPVPTPPPNPTPTPTPTPPGPTLRQEIDAAFTALELAFQNNAQVLAFLKGLQAIIDQIIPATSPMKAKTVNVFESPAPEDFGILRMLHKLLEESEEMEASLATIEQQVAFLVAQAKKVTGIDVKFGDPQPNQ